MAFQTATLYTYIYLTFATPYFNLEPVCTLLLTYLLRLLANVISVRLSYVTANNKKKITPSTEISLLKTLLTYAYSNRSQLFVSGNKLFRQKKKKLPYCQDDPTVAGRFAWYGSCTNGLYLQKIYQSLSHTDIISNNPFGSVCVV